MNPIYSVDTRNIKWSTVFHVNYNYSSATPSYKVAYIDPESRCEVVLRSGKSTKKTAERMDGSSVYDYAKYLKQTTYYGDTYKVNMLNKMIHDYRLPVPKEIDKWKLEEVLA